MADLPKPRRLAQGMGTAVAKRTVFRPEDHQSWARVATRVATGNLSLLSDESYHVPNEFEGLRAAIASGALITSGRHLQHGDKNQPLKNLELFSNCATAPASFLLFYLLLNGAGVGRSYDDDLMLVDWANCPEIRFVLSRDHKDYPKTNKEALDFLLTFANPSCISEENSFGLFEYLIQSGWSRHSYDHHKVEDSREGWAKIVELLEARAFAVNKTPIVFDFSDVRPLGAPIGGMQNRPASGPLSLIRGLLNIQKHVLTPSRRGLIQPWEQAMRIDHYLSQEVQVGGARRAARMSTKDWRDPGIFDFIMIKSEGGLWTSNNSIMVDAEFWEQARQPDSRARAIFNAVTANAYINGEPGFINGDKLEDAMTGFDRKRPVRALPIAFSPCVTKDTKVFTETGWQTVESLIGKPFMAVVAGATYHASGFYYSGQKNVYILRTNLGSELRITAEHEIMSTEGWCPVSMLRPDFNLILPTEVNGSNYATVTSVTPAGSSDVYNCMVSEVHCYNAEGIIVRG